MTTKDYKKKYLEQQPLTSEIILIFVVILLIIFVLEKVINLDFAPQLYLITMGPMMFTIGIAGVKQYYLAYKSEFVQYRKTKRSPLTTATGKKAKRIALNYIIFLILFFITPGLIFIVFSIWYLLFQ